MRPGKETLHSMIETFQHIPVLLDEVLEALQPRPGESYLDVTLGGAGHAMAIGRALVPGGRIVAFDRDPLAVRHAMPKLASLGLPCQVFETSFMHFDASLREAGCDDRRHGGGFDVILADFGLSSPQIDDPCRGFSFQSDGPLDMRMSQSGETAAAFLARTDETTLADILYEYGDIRTSRRLARLLCQRAARGALDTTGALAEVACTVLGHPKPGQTHPATRVFQAIRIAVNDEFGAIDAFLNAIPNWAKPGARLAIIAFHSGEDRRVKNAMKMWQKPCVCPPKIPYCICNKIPLGKPVHNKIRSAGAEEIIENSRSKSAKLRAFRFD